MLAVQPWAGDGGDEELGAVGVGTSVGHGKKTRAGVLLGEVLIRELGAIDRLTTSAVVVGEVTTLEHEVGDHTVERGALVAKALLASSESTEVLSGLGDLLRVEVENNAAQWLAVCSGVEKYLVTHF